MSESSRELVTFEIADDVIMNSFVLNLSPTSFKYDVDPSLAEMSDTLTIR